MSPRYLRSSSPQLKAATVALLTARTQPERDEARQAVRNLAAVDDDLVVEDDLLSAIDLEEVPV